MSIASRCNDVIYKNFQKNKVKIPFKQNEIVANYSPSLGTIIFRLLSSHCFVAYRKLKYHE